MLDDQSIWDTIGKASSFCSFKMKTQTDVLCRNANNVSGMCSRATCPLANSKYATIREIKGKLYLLMKEPERRHRPRSLYEKVELPEDYDKALEMVSQELESWDRMLVHKCKQRLTKLSDYLERKALLDKMGRPEYLYRRRKAEKQDRAREAKAAKLAKVESSIEKEVLERYKLGVYGNKGMLEQEKATVQEERRKKLGLVQTRGIKYVVEFEDEAEEAPEEEKAKKKMKMEW
ncbi:protein MAK16 [Nematocida major]|uniref:protein MAK16 n=1 Tax=Nematocida major TaxID=1912982 RepID=UPI002007EA09|nr:protein MAK16 [Nematocida major]KAH9386633.1 protein MAK16 [Nematocida major]